jgi:hypothetical protein
MQSMQYYAPHADADLTPLETVNGGIVLPNTKEGMEEENGNATAALNNDKMEEDTVEANDDMMQEASKMDEGNEEAGDVAIENKMVEESADEANDKMVEGNADVAIEDKMVEESADEIKNKREEEILDEAKDTMDDENVKSKDV